MSDNGSAVQLSERERQVLEMVATGASNQQIARQLVISVNTVKVHLRNIFEKLGVQSRTEATLRAIQEGWISVADDSAAGLDEAALPSKTFLQTAPARPNLNRGQQVYLLAALLLALAVTIIPLVPRAPARITPNLPVIYAQPPTPAPSNPASNPWTFRAPMPTSRAGLALVAFDGRIFAIGGVRANNKATRLVEIYDPAADSWSEGAAKPTATANIAGAVIDNKIYIPGGCTNTGQAVDALEIYQPKTDSWSRGEPMPEPRCGYGLAILDGTLYLFGGWNGADFEDTVFAFSPQKNAWKILDSPMPQPKGYVGAAALNNTIYVVGGYNGKTEFNQTHIFDPSTGAWTEKAPLNEKRGGVGLIGAANNLYAIGGGWDKAVPTAEKYDPAADAWTTIDAPFSHQWRNMGVTVLDTRVYAAGGWDGANAKFIDSVVSYQFLYQLFLPVSSFGE